MSTMNKTASSAFTVSAYPLAGENGRMLANGVQTWLTATAECQHEMVRFISNRIEKDRATLHEVLGSRDLAQTAAIQSHWVEEAVRDYCAEAARMIAIYMNLAEAGAGKRRV